MHEPIFGETDRPSNPDGYGALFTHQRLLRNTSLENPGWKTLMTERDSC